MQSKKTFRYIFMQKKHPELNAGMDDLILKPIEFKNFEEVNKRWGN